MVAGVLFRNTANLDVVLWHGICTHVYVRGCVGVCKCVEPKYDTLYDSLLCSFEVGVLLNLEPAFISWAGSQQSPLVSALNSARAEVCFRLASKLF